MLKKHLKIFLFLMFFHIKFVFDLNLNASIINSLTFYEKKIVVCDKLAQMKTNKEGGKFRDKILELFGSVTYANKRIIYDRLIENCIKNINETFTEKLFFDLIDNEKIQIKQKSIEKLLQLEKVYKIKPKFFNKVRKNITNVLNKLYHPKKTKNVNKKIKEIEEMNELKEIFILDYIFYYSEKDLLLILFLVAILLFLIIIIIINLDSLYNQKIPNKNTKININRKNIKKNIDKNKNEKKKDVKKDEEKNKDNDDKKNEKNNENKNNKEEKKEEEKEKIKEEKKEEEKKDEKIDENKMEDKKEINEEQKKIIKEEKNKKGKKK